MAEHAIPIIEERMKIIEDAEVKGIKSKLPVGTSNPRGGFLSFFPGVHTLIRYRTIF